MKVVVRTHGGLGNQIFQLFYGRLYARMRGAALYEQHDIRYAHAFGRSVEIPTAPPPPKLGRLISSLRIPKLVTRLGIRRNDVTLFGTTFLDGYFQHVRDYAAFDDASLREELLRLRHELRVGPDPRGGTAVHLRLGDFFTSEAAVAAHLDERLQRVDPGASIITNEEHRLAMPAVAATIRKIQARIVPTGDMSPEEVLRTLARFERVDGNDSTLLFWASVLSGMECAYRNEELRGLRARFLDVLGAQQ